VKKAYAAIEANTLYRTNHIVPKWGTMYLQDVHQNVKGTYTPKLSIMHGVPKKRPALFEDGPLDCIQSAITRRRRPYRRGK
jgi:hypothetical protein